MKYTESMKRTIHDGTSISHQLTKKPFYYLRHGQTDWNLMGKRMGQQDIPLNATGISQAHAAKELLKSHPITLICHSPLERARHTAEIVNQVLNVPMVEIDDLKECCWGIYEGHDKGDWSDDWVIGITPEGAEPRKQFFARSIAAINQALAHDGTVLIVAHSGVYWSVKHYAQLEGSLALENCVPVYHEPPQAENDLWVATFIDKDLTPSAVIKPSQEKTLIQQ
jgi:broad specificity phosphatase PhoE